MALRTAVRMMDVEQEGHWAMLEETVIKSDPAKVVGITFIQCIVLTLLFTTLLELVCSYFRQ